MVLYIEYAKEATKKLLEVINEFSKVARKKTNIQKSVAFLYTDKLSEIKIKKTIQFTTASKRIKYREINLTKLVKNLYSENYKTLMRETEDDINRWKETVYIDYRN